jgi:Holliday junction resolvasome RuvABC ATP-dependent DNA helicase subunit
MNQLKDILPYLYSDTKHGMNILIRGPSGWGKTRMSFMICNYIAGGNFEYCLGDKLLFTDVVRVHFIDEVHLLEHPEVIYPSMDSGKYVIVVATNDVAILPEALVNRCVEFIFDKYTVPELREIARMSLAANAEDNIVDYIVESGAGNPRIIKSIISRLNIILINNQKLLDGISIESFKALLEETFGIKDGMDIMCNRYLEALTGLGGTASLQTISAYLHIDQGTLRFFVEPILLYKNRIKITNKGRSLN